MSYKNPFIKVEWEDVPENLTQERIKRVKTYFEKKYKSTNVKIVTKISNGGSNAKLKSLDANTTSSQKSKTNEIEITDFLNKYQNFHLQLIQT
jgi:hypothetical protein